MAARWEVTLSTAPVGVSDSVMELAGNSLHVLRLSLLATEKGYPVSIRGVFESRTVEGLAARAGALPGEKSLEAPKREARPAVKDVVGEDDMQALLAMLEG